MQILKIRILLETLQIKRQFPQTDENKNKRLGAQIHQEKHPSENLAYNRQV